MSTILLSALPASGHLNPIIAIGQALQAQHHNVFVATDYSYRGQIERAQLQPIDLVYPAGTVANIMQQFQKPARWTSQFHPKPPESYFFDHLDNLVGQLMRIIKRVQPDVLLSDLNFYPGPIAADATQTHYATYCAIVNTLRSTDSPPYGLGSDWKPADHPERLLWPFLNIPVEWVLWRHDRLNNRVRRQYGLSSVRGSMLAHSPYLSMVPTTDAYAYPRRSVPDQIMYVGPVTSPQRGDIHDDFPWEWFDDERPTVYMSMGTVVGAIDIFKAVLRIAIKNPNWKAVFAIGRGTSIDLLGPIPENVIVRNFVPQLEILRRVDAVVSHGGNNTVTETLLQGLPLVVIPISADQPESAGRVKACGAGIRIRPGLAHGKRLENAIEAVLFDRKYRQAAQRVGESYQQTQGAQTCAALVGRLATTRQPVRRKYPEPTITMADIPDKLR